MSTRALLRESSVASVRSRTSTGTEHISFVKTCADPSYFKIVQTAFKKMIQPIYGSQKSAIAKIKDSLDRTCELMFNYENPVGVLVYKNELQNEYGLKKALELKTLFLFNPEKNSGHGFGSKLFRRIDEVAKEMKTQTIYCTASSKVEDSINCALRNGYKIARVLERNEERTLYLLIKEL